MKEPRYIDEPVYKETRPLPIAMSVAEAFGRHLIPLIRRQVGKRRIVIDWMKPDGKGGLVPR